MGWVACPAPHWWCEGESKWRVNSVKRGGQICKKKGQKICLDPTGWVTGCNLRRDLLLQREELETRKTSRSNSAQRSCFKASRCSVMWTPVGRWMNTGSPKKNTRGLLLHLEVSTVWRLQKLDWNTWKNKSCSPRSAEIMTRTPFVRAVWCVCVCVCVCVYFSD